MKLPVIGIIVVGCLQLGFVAYNAIDRPIEALVAVNEVPSGTNVPGAPDISDSPEQSSNEVNGDVVSTPIPRKHKRSSEVTLVSNKTYVKVPVARVVNRMPQFVAQRKQSETKFRIEYPQEKAFDLESKNYQISARAVPRSKKRSFFSKSMSVIKKPYDWLKALGSKLN